MMFTQALLLSHDHTVDVRGNSLLYLRNMRRAGAQVYIHKKTLVKFNIIEPYQNTTDLFYDALNLLKCNL